MSQDVFEFDHPDYFEAEAIGAPGQRRFRVIARQGSQTAALWMERVDVEALIQAMQQALIEITGNDALRVEGDPGVPPPPREDFPATPAFQMHVGRWAIGYDRAGGAIVFVAASMESLLENAEEGDDIDPEFRAMLDARGADQFAERAGRVVAAGRPRCPLCGTPLRVPEEPHACVRQNGHLHIADA